jgi:hypothetical protein
LLLENGKSDFLGLLMDQGGVFVRDIIAINSTVQCALQSYMRAMVPAPFEQSSAN